MTTPASLTERPAAATSAGTTQAARGKPDDRGETLLETILAVAILAITIGTILGVITVGARAAGFNQDTADADAIVENWAALLTAAPYSPCPTAISTPPAPSGWTGSGRTWTSTVAGVPYTATVTSMTMATPAQEDTQEAWKPLTFQPMTWNAAAGNFTCPSGVSDGGVQQLLLEVSATDPAPTTRQLLVTKRNPCIAVAAAGCS